MPTNTYVALRTEVLTSATSSVTFSLSGIAGYTDLVIVSSIQSARAAQLDSLAVRFNGDTGNNYSYTFLFANTAEGLKSARGSNQSNIFIGNFAANSTANTFGTNILQINNYSNSTTFKTTISRSGSLGTGNDDTEATVGLWRNTAAITSVTLRSETGNNFVAGSTFTIYGIANADNFAKATGGIVYDDATYWYHVFGANGTFTPKQALTCDYLIVAGGGGGGGYYAGGGGGGGGFRTASGFSATTTPYAITVGAGGNKGTGAQHGSRGSDSVFSTITSNGGGGGAYDNQTAVAGTYGSGAGGSNSGTGSAGTSGQGTNGGNGANGGNPGFEPQQAGGGGGGATSAGSTATSGGGTSTGGAGGAGTASSISGTSVTYAGGGGGGANNAGAGGTGGGGTGGSFAVPAAGNGTTNLGAGGGGGGRGTSGVGGNGGSGVVIIRYLKA
jgi:hypothetical protein